LKMNKKLLLIIISLFGFYSNYVYSENLGLHAQCSECGGFNSKQSIGDQRSINGVHEKLIWQYDSTSQILGFYNKNVTLNCCGEHSIYITINRETGNYTIYEIDTPTSEGRCRCFCNFDFKIDLPDIDQDSIKVELRRHITESKTGMIVWRGELDLKKEKGIELIDFKVIKRYDL
jgi:hypothetical protein